MAKPNRLAAALSYEQDRPAFGNPSMLEQGRKMRERKQAEQVDRSAQKVKSDLLARALMYRYNPETLTGLTDTPGPQTLDEAAGLNPRVDRSTFLPYSKKEGLHVPAVAADLMKLATASNPQYSNLMQPEEAMPLATNMMGGGVVASRLAPAPAGSLGMNVVAKRAFTAPQDEALRLAQQRAALPVEQGGLGLPAGNTAAQRAAAMEINTDAYHGSKQNITGAFKPGYDDNLGFVTKDPEFANSWIGKGKIQQRANPEAKAELKAAEDLYRAVKEKHMDYGSIDLKSPDFHDIFEKRNDAFKKAFQEDVGLYPDKTHSTVYPLKAQANNTFDPETNIDVMADFFKKNNTSPQMQDIFKSGNYLVYETKPVVNYLKSKGYDSMRLRESTGDNYPTIAVFDPETIRSRFAAFDPFRRNAALAAALGVAAPDLLAEEKK